MEACSSLVWIFNHYALTKIGISLLVLEGSFESFEVLDVLIVDEKSSSLKSCRLSIPGLLGCWASGLNRSSIWKSSWSSDISIAVGKKTCCPEGSGDVGDDESSVITPMDSWCPAGGESGLSRIESKGSVSSGGGGGILVSFT